MNYLVRQFAVLLILISVSSVADAAIVNVLNAARKECQRDPQPSLVINKQLVAAAKQVAQGSKPADAAHAKGYAMTQLASIHLEGFHDEAELKRMLLQRSCKIVGDKDARDAGYFQRGSAVWILIGASRGDPGNADIAAKRALVLVNKARSQPRRCGKDQFAAAPPLVLNPQLIRAAQMHSAEMARLRYLEHEGKDGSTPASRIASTGYKWRLVGENVAAGEGNVDLAISDWLGSPHHCANIMDPRYKEMGIAFASNQDDQEYGVYWTQTFGWPKAAK